MVTNVKAGLVFSAMVLGAGIDGCAGRGPEPPRGTYSTVLQRIDGPFVLGGIEFEAEMEQPIGSDISRPNDVFAARVTKPLLTP